MKKRYHRRMIDRIRAHDLPEPVIRKMRSVIRLALNDTPQQVDITTKEAFGLIEAVNVYNPLVSAAQSARGLHYLRGLAYTPRGLLRNTESAREFTQHDRDVLSADPFFRLVDMELFESGRHVHHVAPVYRVCTPDGRYFEYVSGSWQSGVRFAIIRRNARG